MARPREFDREKALRQAMEAFWAHGYERTSASVLEESMGIGRSSLYATFGSKDELFAESMDVYTADFRSRVIDKLRAEGPPKQVLERFFHHVADRGRSGGERLRFCLVTRASISIAEQPDRIKTRIAAFIDELDAAFYALLQRARQEGALDPGMDLRDTARYLTTTLQALNVAAHAGRSSRELRQMARRALSTLR